MGRQKNTHARSVSFISEKKITYLDVDHIAGIFLHFKLNLTSPKVDSIKSKYGMAFMVWLRVIRLLFRTGRLVDLARAMLH